MTTKAKLINIDDNIDKAVSEAVKCFNAGGVFIYPTDTVYGFGCNTFNDNAVEKINIIKHRKQSKQFILLIDSLSTLSEYVKMPGKTYSGLLDEVWPNPISIIFNLNDDKKKLLGTETAAFRIPDHKFCRCILDELKLPLVSTSVNRGNELPLNNHSIIIDNFSGEVDAILYTKYEENSEPSALINLTGEKPVILRQGSTKFVDLVEKFA